MIGETIPSEPVLGWVDDCLNGKDTEKEESVWQAKMTYRTEGLFCMCIMVTPESGSQNFWMWDSPSRYNRGHMPF
jgi:hypothetical protein